MTDKQDTGRCWEALANAIIIQAATDYKKILLRLKKHPDNTTLAGEQVRIEKFFQSGWFTALCSLDGRDLMWKIRMEARA